MEGENRALELSDYSDGADKSLFMVWKHFYL